MCVRYFGRMDEAPKMIPCGIARIDATTEAAYETIDA
jgi:hypothetical protein